MVVRLLELMVLLLLLLLEDGEAPATSLMRTQSSSTLSIDLFTIIPFIVLLPYGGSAVKSFFETGESRPEGDPWII